jgi:hypothetical protein
MFRSSGLMGMGLGIVKEGVNGMNKGVSTKTGAATCQNEGV